MKTNPVSKFLGRAIALGLTAISFFFTVYSLVFRSPMLAPALVAFFTFGMGVVAFYLSPAFSDGSDATRHS
jgi:hypothetical protein